MSLYKNDITIGGVTCGMVLRGGGNGSYTAVFEREKASLEEIRGIDWSKPEVTGACLLPVGYGFTVADIRYSYSEDCYKVELRVSEQYLGDVTGYQAQVSDLEGQLEASEAEAVRLTGELEEAAAAKAEAEAQRQALEEELDGLSSQVTAAQEQAAQAEEAAAQAKEESEALRTQAQERESDLMVAYMEGVEQDG